MSERIEPLDALLEIYGEGAAKEILSVFSCPLNADVDGFLKNKAIDFNRKAIAKTYVVFSQSHRLLGCFTLANRAVVGKIEMTSRRMQERVDRFALRYDSSDTQILPMILIAQLGKNFSENSDSDFTGRRLLEIASEKVKEAQRLIGGKTTYLECEDAPKLRAFYESNGFVYIGERPTEDGEHGEILLQYIRWID